ncbi:hypothetical protein IAU60_002204 [Kwoniella sp. DSM 27419]
MSGMTGAIYPPMDDGSRSSKDGMICPQPYHFTALQPDPYLFPSVLYTHPVTFSSLPPPPPLNQMPSSAYGLAPCQDYPYPLYPPPAYAGSADPRDVFGPAVDQARSAVPLGRSMLELPDVDSDFINTARTSPEPQWPFGFEQSTFAQASSSRVPSLQPQDPASVPMRFDYTSASASEPTTATVSSPALSTPMVELNDHGKRPRLSPLKIKKALPSNHHLEASMHARHAREKLVKRTRIQVACDGCRQRKVRCHGGEGKVCIRCDRLSLRCIYTPIKQDEHAGPSSPVKSKAMARSASSTSSASTIIPLSSVAISLRGKASKHKRTTSASHGTVDEPATRVQGKSSRHRKSQSFSGAVVSSPTFAAPESNQLGLLLNTPLVAQDDRTYYALPTSYSTSYVEGYPPLHSRHASFVSEASVGLYAFQSAALYRNDPPSDDWSSDASPVLPSHLGFSSPMMDETPGSVFATGPSHEPLAAAAFSVEGGTQWATTAY